MAEAVMGKRSATSKWSVLLGAAFIMATSAIGPGFLTQTAVFTEKFAANFAFAILASIVIDIGAQMNVWRVITMSRMRGQDVANAVLPGLGHFIALLIVAGGLAFNIGNVAGCGLALNVLFGTSVETGAVISCIIAIAIFASKEAGAAMDMVAKALGLLMIVLTTYVMFASNPPVGEAIVKSVLPDDYGILMLPMITLVGGTVGGYITFAGGHRLLDAGIVGHENLKEVNKSAVTGILVTGVMRVILFLAALGVVSAGVKLAAGNPPASVFQHAAGNVGYKFFGIVLWAAAITSVIGAAYTSVSFLTVFTHLDERKRSFATVVFIFLSLLVYVAMGTAPAAILVFVGGFNGLILPIGLTIFTWIGFARSDLMGGYRYSRPLLALSVIVCALTWYMGLRSVSTIFAFLSA